MEMTWSLEALYRSFDDPVFENDLAFVKQSLDELTTWANNHFDAPENPREKAEGYLQRLFDSTIRRTGFRPSPILV